MKIAYIVTRGDAVGGATVHVIEMAAAMRQCGHDVLVLVGGDGPVAERLAAAGVPFQALHHLRRSVQPIRDIRSVVELISALRRFGPDLVSTHTAKAGWIGRAAAAHLGIPVIYTPHGLPVRQRHPGLAGSAFRMAERIAARWADVIVCVCESERRLALENGIASDRQLVVVHNGVRDVHPELLAKPEARPVRIVSVARFEQPKDHASLLHALAGVRRDDWVLDLVGDGPLEKQCRALAAHLGIGDRVNFLGYRQDVDQLLAGAQIFALSSRSEAFPRAILEAMRAGLPVVASDVGGISEALKHGKSGYLISAGDHREFSKALGGLISDAGERRRLGHDARLAYESRFRLEFMIDKTSALYGTIVKQNANKRMQ